MKREEAGMAQRLAGFSNHTLASFASGALAGILASRLLPPLLGQVRGAVQASAGADPFVQFVRDHRHFEDLLARMQVASGRASRMQLLLRLKRGLAAHAMAEEDVVYPLLHELGDPQRVERLYVEHGDIKRHLYALERIVADPKGWAEEARALHAIIAAHASDEEMREFPLLRQALDRQTMTRVSGDVRRERALVL
jgi:hypothetical protein